MKIIEEYKLKYDFTYIIGINQTFNIRFIIIINKL